MGYAKEKSEDRYWMRTMYRAYGVVGGVIGGVVGGVIGGVIGGVVGGVVGQIQPHRLSDVYWMS